MGKRRISFVPKPSLRGVRSSWLILVRNCDLCWLASARWRLLSWISSNRRTFSMAIAAWSAKVEAGVQKVAIANSTVDTFVSMDDELILALVEAGLGGWERYQARIGVARNFSSRVVISSGTTQNRWVALGSLARARPTQATDALIVNFARQQWGDLLAALAKSWRRIYI